jgi:membrane protease YdiL (CAAX protease family)
MKGLFWNRTEARLRAGWRVVLLVLASGVVSTALAGPGRRVLGRLLPVVYANVVEVVVLVLLIGGFLWMAARWLDHRPIVDYGFHLSRAWWLDLGFGLALGVSLMAGVYALALAIGWVKVTGTLVSPPGQPFIGAILADIVVVVGIACWEEAVFRGYVIKNLAEGLNSTIIGARWATVIAIVIPSVLFGLAHLSNANATMLSTLNTIIFGVAYALTGELAIPIGLHFAWVFVQGFGLGRSGDAPGLGAFLVVVEGDSPARLWTGWPFTLEGGLLGTAALVVGLLLIAAWVRLRRGSVRLDPSLVQPPIRHQRPLARAVLPRAGLRVDADRADGGRGRRTRAGPGARLDRRTGRPAWAADVRRLAEECMGPCSPLPTWRPGLCHVR